MDAKVGKLKCAKSELGAGEPALEERSRDNGPLEVDRGRLRAAIGRGERVIHNFAKRVCSVYTSVVRARASSF